MKNKIFLMVLLFVMITPLFANERNLGIVGNLRVTTAYDIYSIYHDRTNQLIEFIRFGKTAEHGVFLAGTMFDSQIRRMSNERQLGNYISLLLRRSIFEIPGDINELSNGIARLIYNHLLENDLLENW